MLAEEELQEKFAHYYRLISSRNAEGLSMLSALLDETLNMPFPWNVKGKIAEAHYYLSIPNDYVRALDITHEIETILATQTDAQFYPTVLSINASCYNHLGQIDKAEECFLKSIAAFDALTQKKKSDYHRLGSNYFNLLKLEQGRSLSSEAFESYIQKAIQAFEQGESASGLSNCYNLMAERAYNGNDFEQALELMFKAFSINEHSLSKTQTAIFCNNISRIYTKKGELHLAEEWYQKGLMDITHVESAYTWGAFHSQRMEVLMLQNRIDEAIATGLQSMEAFKKIDSIPDLSGVYSALSKCYALEGNYEKAYHYQSLHVQFNEQLFSKEKTIAIARAQQAFEWEQKEKDNLILQQKTKEIQTYARQLEIKNDDLNHFTHAMSHDLKEPLRTIHSMLTLLERSFEQGISPLQQEYIQFVHEAVARLTELVDSVLDYSRLSANENKDVDLNQVVKLTKANLAALFAERKVMLEMDTLPVVKGDETLLVQLFQNILSNAVKYNDSPIPQVSVRYERKENKEVISISDNGIGIPEKFRARIFELFQRLHSKAEYSGSGVGLAVCKKIMQQINGEIDVTDNPTGGSIFILVFSINSSEQ